MPINHNIARLPPCTPNVSIEGSFDSGYARKNLLAKPNEESHICSIGILPIPFYGRMLLQCYRVLQEGTIVYHYSNTFSSFDSMFAFASKESYNVSEYGTHDTQSRYQVL